MLIYHVAYRGADSDICMDICEKVKPHGVRYVWFDTGIEYQATKDHLTYLEKKYNITIDRRNAVVPVPMSNKTYGEPFLSKYVSEMISRLQRHGFDWKDEPYETSVQKYPNCKAALKWFNNQHGDYSRFKYSRFDISGQRYLREFLISNPPEFQISARCCDGAKKNVAKKYIKESGTELMILGLRKSEGGVRAGAYHNCFSASTKKGISEYRPIFWFTDKDRKEYENLFHIRHSRCYTEYGFRRTGCAGCPYGGKELTKELAVIETYEPKLCKAVKNIFHDSYEYTRKYYEFRKMMEVKEKNNGDSD